MEARAATAERPRTAPNFGLVEFALAPSTILQTRPAQKATATTAGTQTFARVSARLAQPPCAAEDSRSDASTTAAATAEVMAHASL